MSGFRRLEIVEVLYMKNGQEKSNPGHFGGGEMHSELFSWQEFTIYFFHLFLAVIQDIFDVSIKI